MGNITSTILEQILIHFLNFSFLSVIIIFKIICSYAEWGKFLSF